MEQSGGGTSPRHSYPPPHSSTSMKGQGETAAHGGDKDNGQQLVRSDSRASTYATAAEERDPDTAGVESHSASGDAGPAPPAPRAGDDDDVDMDSDSDSDDDDQPPPASAAATTITPAAQLRLSLARRLMHGLSQLRSRSRFVLLFQGAFTLAQIGAFIAMLVLSAHQDCNKPLRTFIALHVVRVALAYPVSFYNALAPPARPPRGEEDTPESRQRREARRVMGNPRLDARLRTASDLIALFSLVWFFLGNVWLYSATECRDTSPYMWYSTLSILIIAYIRVAELVVIVLAVVFFLPLVILVLRMFGGLEKKHEIGPLSKDEIAKLPAVYYVPLPESAEKPTTSTDVEKTGESSAANASAPVTPLSALSSQQHKPETRMSEQASSSSVTPSPAAVGAGPSDNDSTKEDSKASVGQSAPANKTHHRRHNILRLFFKRRRGATKGADDAGSSSGSKGDGIYISMEHPLHPLPDNLSSCPICLSDYEPPPLRTAPVEERTKALEELEVLTLLPCGHTIHKDCLAPWLQTSGRCPVCQRAVRGDGENKQKKSRLGRLGRRRQRRQARRQADGAETAAPATTLTTQTTNVDIERGPASH